MNGQLKNRWEARYDKVCWGLVLASNFLSYGESQPSLVDETPGEGIYDNRIPSGGFVFRQIRGVQRKTLSALAVF